MSRPALRRRSTSGGGHRWLWWRWLSSGRREFERQSAISHALAAFFRETFDANALAEIEADYQRHSRKAREIACEHLEAGTVLKKFLHEIGI